MDVLEVIKTRRSIRKYKPQRIPDDILHSILDSARFAPSASSRYPWGLVVVRDTDTKKSLSMACNNYPYVKDCDTVIVGFGDPSQKYFVTDLSVAMEHIALTAWDNGIGSCWIGYFNEDMIKMLLHIPQDRVVVACMTLGYPDESPGQRPKKELSDIVFWERFSTEQTSPPI